MSNIDPEPTHSQEIGALRKLQHAQRQELSPAQIQELMQTESVWSTENDEEGKPNTMVEQNLKLSVDLRLVEPPAQKEGPYRLRENLRLANLGYEDCIKELGRRILDGRRAP